MEIDLSQEEWDQETIDLLDQIVSEISAKKNNLTQPPPSHISQPLPVSLTIFDGCDNDMPSFSPPRELSQRVSHAHCDQENINTKLTQARSASISHPVSNSLFGFDGGDNDLFMFSPPRELSQRVSNVVAEKQPRFQNGGRGRGNRSTNLGKNDKEKEIQMLKKELGRLSQELLNRDQNFLELKKDRDEKDGQLKYALAQVEAKDAEIHCLKRSGVQSEACAQDSGLLQAHGTGNHLVQDESGYPTDTKDPSIIPWTRERTSRRLSRNPSSSILKDEESSLDKQFESHSPSRKKVPGGGSSVASDLQHRLLIDSALRPRTPNECPIQEAEILRLGTNTRQKCSKTIGVQTDPWEDSGHCSTEDNLSAKLDFSKKLIGIWQSANDKRSGKNLVSKLFATCGADLYVIFRCMSMSNNRLALAEKSLSDRVLHDSMQPVESDDAEKVGQLYVILVKMINEMAELDTLLEALFDLCFVENVDIAYRSLCVMHVILHHLLSFEMRSCRRDSIVAVDSRNINVHEDKTNIHVDKILGCQENIQQQGVSLSKGCDMTSCRGLFSSSKKSHNTESLCKECRSSCRMVANSYVNWMELFEKIHRIALGNMDPCIKEEAVSIMNLIIMGSNPNNEREKFGTMPLFESMSQLLCEKVGVLVRLQVVRLLFLLLNCPKVLKLFCLGCKDGVECATSNNDPEPHGRCRSILDGLAKCLPCNDDNIQERILGRHAIHVLAFIATSDKSGIEVLLNPWTSKRINFLELLVKTLSFELDAEVAVLAKSKTVASEGLCKERTSLMREALILLCRLVSNSTYSGAVLQALTSSRTMSRLTVDVTNRIIGMNQADLGELARVFRARILSSS